MLLQWNFDITEDQGTGKIWLLPGGRDSHMKQTGILVGNFEFTPKGDHLGVAQAFCDP